MSAQESGGIISELSFTIPASVGKLRSDFYTYLRRSFLLKLAEKACSIVGSFQNNPVLGIHNLLK